MAVFSIRTEDLKADNVRNLFVETDVDRQVIDALKSADPTILVGSRGTGKSFLMRVAEYELNDKYADEKVLPVYVSFKMSSLVQVTQRNKFLSWMMAKVCNQIGRTLRKRGVLPPIPGAILNLNSEVNQSKFEAIAEAFENSWKNPDQEIDVSALPDLDDFVQEIEDICEGAGINRICLLFDEAAHVFRQAQQHAFFTLFRDLRSPYISCNAAVYPGVTSYGDEFEMMHDATPVTLDRDLRSANYLSSMLDIADKQIVKTLESGSNTDIEEARKYQKMLANGMSKSVERSFNAVAHASSGNPRHFLKILSAVALNRSSEVDGYIKDYYRSEIWKEHGELGEKYQGLRGLIDWGRGFIENVVLKDTLEKNKNPLVRGSVATTSYFWVSRNCPAQVSKALGLLSYAGIVRELDRFVRATRNQIGTRYYLNTGILLSDARSPIASSEEIIPHLSVKRMSEYGANHSSYEGALGDGLQDDDDLLSLDAVKNQLSKSIDILELTRWQKAKLRDNGLVTIQHVLDAGEEGLRELHMIGDVRSRVMSNAAMNAVIEYLLG